MYCLISILLNISLSLNSQQPAILWDAFLHCLNFYSLFVDTPMRQSLAIKQEQTPAEQERRASRDSFVSHYIFSKADVQWAVGDVPLREMKD